MATLIGVLVDTSSSMRSSYSATRSQQSGPWARSIFKVVDNLVKHDVPQSNKIFTLGFGGAHGQPESFDLLSTLKLPDHHQLSTEAIIEKIFRILERNGAPSVRYWASKAALYEIVDRFEASLILDKLQTYPSFLETFVNHCLPEDCRRHRDSLLTSCKDCLLCCTNAVGPENFVTNGIITDVINKARDILPMSLEKISQDAIMGVQTASTILHEWLGQEELTGQRVDKILKTIQPFIYGATPLIATISQTVDLFSIPDFKSYNKLLFILSDGQPSDGNNPPISKLTDLGVTIVCCLITNDSIKEPRRLYGRSCPDWSPAAQLMFNMSSALTTQEMPLTIFLKRGWGIDFTNNETRLFVQVNHPAIIDDVCELARDVVSCQEALSDVLSTVSMDLYINQAINGVFPPDQVGATCYANASATVMHLAMKRIVGREGGYPDFLKLRSQLITKYGSKGANTVQVLQEMCPEYRLQCESVDINGAMNAICAKRPVIATFRLNDDQWRGFNNFYHYKPNDTLTESDLSNVYTSRSPTRGHAVVLTSFSSGCLRFMNSWGIE